MTTSISGQSFVDRTMTTQTAAATSDPTKVSFTAGDGEKTTEFIPDGNKAANHKKTAFDGQNLALPMDQLANPGVPQKTMDRLKEMAASGGTVTLPSMEEASVSQSTNAKGEVSYTISTALLGHGGTTTTVSAADLASGNLSQDVKDLLGDITAGKVFVPAAKTHEPATAMPAPASDLEKGLQKAVASGGGSIELEGDMFMEPFSVTFKDGAYAFEDEAGQAHQITTLTPDQIAGKTPVPAGSEAERILTMLKATPQK